LRRTPNGAPGGTHITEWNGAAGYIWRIEFPEGPPPGFATPGNAPGVKEYRDWVRDNAPDVFDTLFVAGIEMRLDTQEVRDAHTEMVARYVAALAAS
jgi:hypothetical protein